MGATVREATVDWSAVVNEIRAKGMMAKAIARHAKIAPSTLGNLVSGLTAEPPYSVGVRILELHAKLVR